MRLDEWSFRLGTVAQILIAANADPKQRSEIPKWHEIFPPASVRYQNALAEHDSPHAVTAPELPANVTGKMLDAFALRQKEAAKKKRRGRRKLTSPCLAM